MTALKTRAGPAAALAQVEKFYANQLEDPDPLSKVERAKIEDLRGDARWFDREASSRHPRWMAWRGRLFEWFERWIGGRLWPHWLWHGIESVRRWLVGKPLPSGPVPHAHGIPHGIPVEPLVFAVDFRLFDRLSVFYGGEFRGSVLLNYTLGTIAGGALILVLLRLSGLGVPFGLQSLIEWLDHHGIDLPLGLIVETLCIVSILIIYLRGRTPERTGGVLDFTRPLWAGRWHQRWLEAGRWHQRWLEYRVLAERFRSFELLLPLGAEFTQRPPFVPEELPSRFWHERYYLWSIAGKKAEVPSVRAYRERVLSVMAAQEHYHAHNYRRCGAIAHRLHAVATFLFFAALIIGFFELCIEFGWFKYLEECRPALVFFAALFPIVSAAIHGVLAQSEYTKLAETSGEVAVRIRHQYEQFVNLAVSDDPANAETQEKMRKTVLAFAETVINEASGWKAMLRDKNVPLT